jgi:NAD(P)-dependent dehydrogenase (short-subunit alcohol dehydrogenase family)
VALAVEGFDIIAIDRCSDIDLIPYPPATEQDLTQTANLIRKAGGRVKKVIADVRDLGALQAAIDSGWAQFGDIDVVIANAGLVGTELVDRLDLGAPP